MRIAVAGGTGTVGQHVVEQATRAGHEVVVLSRSNGVDLVAGDGVRAAIEGADAVIDVASIQTLSARASREFFGTVTENLLAAARGADVHHVALSIVGAAQAPHGYYAGKFLQEQRVAASAGHWSILRVTQFHEFAVQVLAQAKVLGAHLVPRMRSQPVAASEVAAALIQIVESGAHGNGPDLAGPREERMADLVRSYLRKTGSPERVLEVRLPGALGAAMAQGGLLPGPGARLGSQTFDDWLAQYGGSGRTDDR